MSQMLEQRRFVAVQFRRFACELCASGQLEFVEYVIGIVYELRALFDQRVAPFGERRMNGTGQREHFASLFVREPGGDQRTALQPGLDNQASQAHAADQAIAARKVGGERWRAER